WPGGGGTWLFGGEPFPGSGNLGDLWQFDGSSWNAEAVPAGLGAPDSRRLTWVPDAGGHDGLLLASETGPTWLLTRSGGAVAAQPAVRADEALAYDPRRGRIVIFGGSSSSGAVLDFDDTWELRRGELRPAEVCQLHFAAARATDAVLTGVAVEAQAGAEAHGAP